MYKSVIKKKKNLKDKSRRYVLWLQKPAWRPDGSTWLNRGEKLQMHPLHLHNEEVSVTEVCPPEQTSPKKKKKKRAILAEYLLPANDTQKYSSDCFQISLNKPAGKKKKKSK